MSTTLTFEQEGYDGNIIQLKKTFKTQDEKFNWIKDMKASARHIGKYFAIIKLQED